MGMNLNAHLSLCLLPGENDYRGGYGPLHVSRGKMLNPLFQAFIDAGMSAGYPYTEDVNGYQQEGVGPYDMTIHNGKRWSASQAYLRPALKRKNLETRVKANATRILFEGTKAVGVEYIHDNQIRRAKATKELILAGGAINSPHLMMLSGIGDSEELKQHGLKTVIHLPGVGKNLQDHLEVYVQNVSYHNVNNNSHLSVLSEFLVINSYIYSRQGFARKTNSSCQKVT